MTLDQISEYLKGWVEENASEKNKASGDLVNPTIEELELFNISAGIARQEIPKK